MIYFFVCKLFHLLNNFNYTFHDFRLLLKMVDQQNCGTIYIAIGVSEISFYKKQHNFCHHLHEIKFAGSYKWFFSFI